MPQALCKLLQCIIYQRLLGIAVTAWMMASTARGWQGNISSCRCSMIGFSSSVSRCCSSTPTPSSSAAKCRRRLLPRLRSLPLTKPGLSAYLDFDCSRCTESMRRCTLTVLDLAGSGSSSGFKGRLLSGSCPDTAVLLTSMVTCVCLHAWLSLSRLDNIDIRTKQHLPCTSVSCHNSRHCMRSAMQMAC